MDITPLTGDNAQLVDKYGAGGFVIAGHSYDGSVLVLPQQTQPLNISGFEQLSVAHFAPLLALDEKPEIVLIGCGQQMQLLPKQIRDALGDGIIGVDTMDTGAACRTYNVLMAEDRRVAALLIAI